MAVQDGMSRFFWAIHCGIGYFQVCLERISTTGYEPHNGIEQNYTSRKALHDVYPPSELIMILWNFTRVMYKNGILTINRTIVSFCQPQHTQTLLIKAGYQTIRVSRSIMVPCKLFSNFLRRTMDNKLSGCPTSSQR